MSSSAPLEQLEQTLERSIENVRQIRIVVSDFQPQGQPGLTQKLQQVVKDTELKELYLTTPMLMGARKRNSDSQQPVQVQTERRVRGGAGPGKGGSKSRKGKGLFRWTPDGRMICFKFNNEGETCDGTCGMVHCCQICLLTDHARYNCPQKGKGKGNKGGKKGKGGSSSPQLMIP